MRKIELPSKSFLDSVLLYNPDSGEFCWRVSLSARARAGQPAFLRKTTHGYRRATIKGQEYYAHRVAWKMFYGTEPDLIDHLDGNTSNNAICNLRSVDQSGNQRNRAVSEKSKTGVIGVTKMRGKFRADITVNQEHIYLGLFETLEEAKSARELASRAFQFTPSHGRPK